MHPPHAAARPRHARLAASLTFLGLVLPAVTFAFNPSGLLEIHHVNVQQGDCTLIIGPDGTTVLIDGGNTGKGNNEVVPYFQSLGLLPADGLDYMINTHRDVDHLGGLDEIIYAGYDVEVAVWDNGSDKTGVAISDFLDAAATTTAGPVTAIPLGTVIALGDGATARCVAVKGDVLGHGSVPGALNNENDMSVAILVQYGGFDYLTAGDLGGGDSDNSCTGRSTSQVNVESPLAIALMPGGGAALLTGDGLEVLDVNHHGSESSTNSEFMNLLTPSVAAINVGPGQGGTFHHPRKDVVEKVLMAQATCVTADGALVLQTEEGDPTGSNTSFAGYCSGDIIVKTSGSGTFEVSGTGDVSAGPDERVAAGIQPPADLPFDGVPDTTPPVVAVLAPDGGEVWQEGTQQQITWSATDNIGVTGVDLEYSTTGSGGPFTVIATAEPNDGAYAWTIPSLPTTNAFVRVTAWDGAGNSAADLSDGAFTIETAPAGAALVINEIMKDPDAVPDDRGEWFELYNPGAVAVDIDGWTIRDDGVDLHVVSDGGPLLVPAGGYFVLGINGNSKRNGKYTANYVYSSFLLANGADEVVLLDSESAEVDRVDYLGGSPWPSPTGASLELIDAGSDNNAGTSWAAAVDRGGTYTGNGDLGTPGGPNSVSGGSLLAASAGATLVRLNDADSVSPSSIPIAFELAPAQPNPFQSRTTLRLALPRQARVSAAVFDLRGRRVADLVEETLPPGYHDLSWDGQEAGGVSAAAGVYFLRVLAGEEALVRRVVLLY